jgi:hypothetical protein
MLGMNVLICCLFLAFWYFIDNKKIKSNGRLQKQQYEPLLCHTTAMLMFQYVLGFDYNVGIHLFHVISIVRLPVVRYVSRKQPTDSRFFRDLYQILNSNILKSIFIISSILFLVLQDINQRRTSNSCTLHVLEDIPLK